MAVLGGVSSLAPGVGILAHAGGFLGGALAVWGMRALAGSSPAPQVVYESPNAVTPITQAQLAQPRPQPVAMPPAYPPTVAAPPQVPATHVPAPQPATPPVPAPPPSAPTWQQGG